MESNINSNMKSLEAEPLVDKDTSHQVFGNSPTMLALCLTAIGLIKIYASLERITTLLDNFLAFGVIAFLLATLLSYLAIRATTRRRQLKLGHIADFIFLGGLGCAAVVAILITWTLAG